MTEALIPRYTAQIHQAKRREAGIDTNTKGKKDRGFSGVKHKGNDDDKSDTTPPNNGGSPASGVVAKFKVVEAIAA